MMGTVTASAGRGVVVLGVVVVVVDVVVVWNRLWGGGAEVVERLWDGKWIRNAVLLLDKRLKIPKLSAGTERKHSYRYTANTNI